jgi:REP element-mobilizing transposase RayT
MWKHWTARTSTPLEPFRHFETAQWFWNHLQKKFPQALGAILMPNHLHLLLPFESTTSETRNHAILNGLMGSLSKVLQEPALWQRQSEPKLIPDRHHLRRNVRYVALNPCRKNLCKDPLEWPWSTYRDLFGSTVNQWVSSGRLAHTLGENKNTFESQFHNYVSSDPSVAITGTALSKASSPKNFSEVGIIEILNATSAALRMPPGRVRRPGIARDLFIHLACQQGWKKPASLAEICGITPRAINTIISRRSPDGIRAAALCLGDRRLRELPTFLKHEEFSSKRKSFA